MSVDPRLMPECARCCRPVDDVIIERSEGQSLLIHVLCHGHVDVIEIDLFTRYVLQSMEFQFKRAFTGGIGKPSTPEAT